MNMNRNRPRLCWLSRLVLVFVLTEVTEAIDTKHMCVKYEGYRNKVRIYDFMSMRGTITTRLPGTDYYERDLKCVWYLDAGAPGRVKLTFVNVDLQRTYHDEKCSEHDHLLVQNSLGRYKKYVCPEYHAEQFISFGRGTSLTFQSDSRSRDNGCKEKGIEIKYEFFTPGSQKCPPDWVCGPENDDGVCRCYHLMSAPSSKVDFHSAQKFCGFSNANLVKIESRRMHEFIQRLILKSRDLNVTHFWIGLNDIEKEGTFEWIDRSALSFYNRRKENRETYNCVIQEVATGSWVPVPCDERHFYVCEIFSAFDTTVYRVPKRPLQPEEDKELMNVIKVLAVVGGIILTVIICCVCCCCCRSSSTNKNNPSTGQTPNPAGGDQLTSVNFIPPPPVEPTAPPMCELQPMAPQGYQRDPDGLPSYEECIRMEDQVRVK